MHSFGRAFVRKINKQLCFANRSSQETKGISNLIPQMRLGMFKQSSVVAEYCRPLSCHYSTIYPGECIVAGLFMFFVFFCVCVHFDLHKDGA